MLLAVAVRTATTHVGVFGVQPVPDARTGGRGQDGQRDGDGELLASWRVATDERRTADDHARLLRSLLADGRADASADVRGVVVGSVVPGVGAALRAAVEDGWPRAPCVVLGPGVRTGLAVRTDDPRELGADRVANAVGALARHGSPCVVVDLGSVTCVDVLNARGEHVGGAIAPGLDLAADALHRHAPALRRVELARPRRAVGRTTAEALQAGVVYGAAGSVDGLVRRVTEELGERPVVVATGVHAPLVVADAATVDVHDPHLTLFGLRRVFARASG